MDLQNKLDRCYTKLSVIGENNLVRKKKEETKDIYKEILRVKEEEKKAEEEAIKEGRILPTKKINRGGFFATEVLF